MAVDIWSSLRGGGRLAIDLLEYSVISVQLEIMFVHLVSDYKFHPTAHRALALFDVFCARGAPALIDASEALPPRNLALVQEVQRIRSDMEHADLHNAGGSGDPRRAAIPARYLFDAAYAVITSAGHERMRHIGETYEPTLTPIENLPGGRMTAGQRIFVDRVWQGQVRPHLVQAGFPRIAAIGA